MTATTFRELSALERGILAVLLSHDFPGRTQVKQQLARARVREVDEEGSLEFDVKDAPRAPVTHRVPTEASYSDADGGRVNLLLHVVEGVVCELEVYKDDGSTIIRRPEPERLSLTSR